MKYLLFLSVLFFTGYSYGSEPVYEINPVVDVPVTVVTGLTSLGLHLFSDYTSPEQCRWCSTFSPDEKVRSTLKWKDTDISAVSSDLLLSSLVTATFSLGIFEKWGEGWKKQISDAILITEILAVSTLLNGVTKRVVARQRPYVRNEDESGYDVDYYVSFYSGHTSTAFAMATAATMIYGDKWLPQGVFAGIAFFSAATVGYLRIAADRHYLSDVVTGAVTGALTSWIILKLHKGKKEKKYSFYFSPLSGGGTIGGISGYF
ncbi:MAG: phosphatase PAP2 family protein [Deltaproteobacteria bacterium]|nr:phosphatase PAP2 family protein [Deltaproteobacteria bacterium]